MMEQHDFAKVYIFAIEVVISLVLSEIPGKADVSIFLAEKLDAPL